ncbi:MAG TPA: molybdate ABC transporter substrate-binding protein [Nautiliaceae bacterium]|nr:molybdate ABC transporter substrate-binding protein [Nautiliaceae bacterium]
MRAIVMMFFINILFANELLFYCGTTMKEALKEIATLFEKKRNVKIKFIVGGSKSLLEKIKMLKKGDLYLPGSENYILKNKDLFLDYKYVGYNKLALIVKKHNPKNIKGLNSLFKRDDLMIVLCNPELSSCGRATKKFLKERFLYLYFQSSEIMFDSKDLSFWVKRGADVGISWRAIANSKINKSKLDYIDIDSPKHNLYLSIIKYTNNYNLSKEFLEFVTSKKGKEIMKKYGFLDEK